jgi:hypothetical protein
MDTHNQSEIYSFSHTSTEKNSPTFWRSGKRICSSYILKLCSWFIIHFYVILCLYETSFFIFYILFTNQHFTNISTGALSKIDFCKCRRNIVFQQPVYFLYTLFAHYTSVHSATRLLSLSPSRYVFRPYTVVIRYLCLLKLFHCVVCATSAITCKCDISLY